MLEFHAKMAFLAKLHHPNSVLFIGACVKRPNLCIVTEFVENGHLRNVDENVNVKVADFGFAGIKENATMTCCGTPCWTGVA